MLVHLGDQKYTKTVYSEILLQLKITVLYFNILFYNWIYFCNDKAEFYQSLL